MVEKVTLVPFWEYALKLPRDKYPIKVTGYDEDGDLIGAIDGSKLTTAQRINLCAVVGAILSIIKKERWRVPIFILSFFFVSNSIISYLYIIIVVLIVTISNTYRKGG